MLSIFNSASNHSALSFCPLGNLIYTHLTIIAKGLVKIKSTSSIQANVDMDNGLNNIFHLIVTIVLMVYGTIFLPVYM